LKIVGGFLLGAVVVAAGPVAAQSGCYYDGALYPHGTRVGGLVCDNGQWVGG
jgi:hypothetical protein